jgi:hypothetical protein
LGAKAFAQTSVLMTVFCVGTLSKARPSVTPWNERIGDPEAIFLAAENWRYATEDTNLR